MKKETSNGVWYWVAGVFGALLVLWAWFITTAVKNAPETVPLVEEVEQ